MQVSSIIFLIVLELVLFNVSLRRGTLLWWKMSTISSQLWERQLGGGCVLTIENLMKPLEKIIFPSLYWPNAWEVSGQSFLLLFRWIFWLFANFNCWEGPRKKLILHVLLELLHIDGCYFDFVKLMLLLKDAWCLFSMI